jgi:hypothetical protein
MPPLWHVQRGSVTRSRGLTSPGSYQRSASATPVRLPDRAAPSAHGDAGYNHGAGQEHHPWPDTLEASAAVFRAE